MKVKHHYSNITETHYVTERVCEKKPAAQGALEGAVIGGLLGEAIGGEDSREGLALFGLIVGANEAQYQTVCKDVIKPVKKTQRGYTHSTITFTENGKMYSLKFYK